MSRARPGPAAALHTSEQRDVITMNPLLKVVQHPCVRIDTRMAGWSQRRQHSRCVRCTTLHPLLRGTAHRPVLPITAASARSVLAARHDVRHCGAALALRTTARRTSPPHLPCCLHSRAPATQRTARRRTTTHAGARQGPRGSAARRAALRRCACAARSSLLRPHPARPRSGAHAAQRTARRRTTKHTGARPGPRGSAARRVALRRCACAARSSLLRPHPARRRSGAPAAQRTARRRAAKHTSTRPGPRGSARRRAALWRCA